MFKDFAYKVIRFRSTPWASNRGKRVSLGSSSPDQIKTLPGSHWVPSGQVTRCNGCGQI